MDQSFASLVAVLDRRFAIRVAVYRLDNDFGSFILLVSQRECGLGRRGVELIIERYRLIGFAV